MITLGYFRIPDCGGLGRSERPLDEKGLGREKGLSIAPTWERDQVRFHNSSGVGFRPVGMIEVGKLLLDVLLLQV